MAAVINTREQKLLTKAGIFAKDIAEAHIEDARANWSSYPPSTPGRPPAMRSGNLDSSPYIEYRAGGALFTRMFSNVASNPEDFPIAIVNWDTTKGSYEPENKRGYAGYLETGTVKMKRRPFVRASLRRIRELMKAEAKRILKP